MKRSNNVFVIGAMGVAGIAMLAASFAGRKPVLIWNYTASAPLGLYRSLDRPWQKGDWVAVKPEPRIAAMLTQFGALKSGRLLIKRVAAVTGDEVCRHARVITIDEKWSADARSQTSRGAHLPNWGGCLRLSKGEVLLLGEAEASFDGRYFGVSQATSIVGPMHHIGW